MRGPGDRSQRKFSAAFTTVARSSMCNKKINALSTLALSLSAALLWLVAYGMSLMEKLIVSATPS